MRIAVDLHIHSCLSPCCDDEMTPIDIVNMASIKGLDAIAITDHNSCANLPGVALYAESAGVLLLPGIEVTTSEEVHMLCYFEDIDTAVAFAHKIYETMPDFKNRPDIFGNQIIMDSNDEVCGYEEKMLSQSCGLSINEIYHLSHEYNGVCIPAHVNKPSYSIMSNLGFIPKDPVYNYVEVHKNSDMHGVDLARYNVLYSSDAHTLEKILEKTFFINVENKDTKSIIKLLRTGISVK